MATALPRDLRSSVVGRTHSQCEYCQKPDDRGINPHRHEVDHILATKHGGRIELENLAYACFHCNRYKGADIASLDPQTNELVRLFNPRTQNWVDHFLLQEDGVILSRTAEGRATTQLLHVNDPERTQVRADL